MAVTRSHAMGFVGQRVVVRTHDGVTHHGILHSVTPDGVYLRPMPGDMTRLAADCTGTRDVDVLQHLPQVQDDASQVWFPFLFFPFLALAALWPWYWYW